MIWTVGVRDSDRQSAIDLLQLVRVADPNALVRSIAQAVQRQIATFFASRMSA